MPKLICQLSVEQPPATKDPPGAPKKTRMNNIFQLKARKSF